MKSPDYSFVASIENLHVDGVMGSSWNIGADLKITNSRTTANKISNPTLSNLAGKLEIDQILSGEPFVYAMGPYPLDDDSQDTQMKLLNARLRVAVSFCNTLWIIKDNSINIGRGFLQFPIKGNDGSRVSLNNWIIQFSDARGELTSTEFSKQEIRTAISMHKKLYSEESLHDISAPLKPSHVKKVGRLSRALYFLQAARASDDLPVKIANYCTIFETLVSTSATELAHQVAERVAILIGIDSDETLEIYRSLKRAYSTRSKLVHGDDLRVDNQRYINESILCDGYLRRLLHLVISNPDVHEGIDGKSEEVERFFLAKLFGG